MFNLLRCPCCGGRASYLEEREWTIRGTKRYIRVKCWYCGLSTDRALITRRNELAEKSAKNHVAKLWNKRIK